MSEKNLPENSKDFQSHKIHSGEKTTSQLKPACPNKENKEEVKVKKLAVKKCNNRTPSGNAISTSVSDIRKFYSPKTDKTTTQSLNKDLIKNSASEVSRQLHEHDTLMAWPFDPCAVDCEIPIKAKALSQPLPITTNKLIAALNEDQSETLIL